MICVKKAAKAKKLYISGLLFRRAVKMVERYWDARPGLVFITCYGIRHQRIESFEDQPQKDIICISPHRRLLMWNNKIPQRKEKKLHS